MARLKNLEEKLADNVKKFREYREDNESIQKQQATEIKFLKRENECLSLLTEGKGPPVPAGYMCNVCQLDVLKQNKVTFAQNFAIESNARQLGNLLRGRGREVGGGGGVGRGGGTAGGGAANSKSCN